MSDTATPTPSTPSNATPAPAAAPQAPASQPASTPAGQTPAQPTQPLAQPLPSVRDAKAALRHRQGPGNVADARAALHHAQNQPREPDGKFAATDSQASPAVDAVGLNADAAKEAVPATTPAGGDPGSSAPPAADATTATAVAEGMVRIHLPEGSSLRGQTGREFYDVPAADEQYHRWAIKNEVRRNEVENAANIAREWQQYAGRLKAELDATREFTGGIFNDPTVIAQIQDIRNTYGDEAADMFAAGLWQKQQAKVQELTQKQQQQEQITEKQTYVNTFASEAFTAALRRYPEWSQQEIADAMAAYGSWVEARNGDRLDLKEFLQHADPVYLQNPRARAAAQSRADAKREQERASAAKAEADRLAAEQQKQLEEVAAQRRNYPWLGVPATAQPGHVVVPTEERRMSVHEARRSLRRRGAAAGA